MLQGSVGVLLDQGVPGVFLHPQPGFQESGGSGAEQLRDRQGEK